MKRKRYHWLAEVINTNGFVIGAEVGAATGNTTRYLLDNCPRLKRLIVADDWRPIPGSGQWESNDMKQIFLNKFKNESRVNVYEGLSWAMANHLDDYLLDFVFIDASHDYESFKKDLIAWVPKVHKNGIICGHDLHFKGVARALNEMIPNYEIAGIDNCWYVRKRDVA